MFLGEIVSLKSDDEASLESDPLCGGAPERNTHHRPIKVNDLWNHIKEMKLNRCVGFKREYEVKQLYHSKASFTRPPIVLKVFGFQMEM